MLTELRVRDLAVIADATLTLGPGLNVLSGETGAGKSMLVDALALLLGERASGDLVRPGAERAVIEAAFDVTGNRTVAAAAREAGVDLDEGRLVFRREINLTGPNRAWANGSPSTVSTLAELGRLLVDLHGQHEAQSLFRSATQRDILDAFAGAGDDRAEVRAAYERAHALAEEMETLLARRDDVQRRADYLRHVAKEITDAAPKLGEDAALEAEAKRLAHAEDVMQAGSALADLLDGEDAGVLDQLGRAERLLDQLERYDPTVSAWRELLDAASAGADELARAARAYVSDVDLDPARLDRVERRRDLLFRLTQKYGPTLDDVLRTGDETRAELDLLDTAALDLSSLEERRTEADAALERAVGGLREKRRRAAGQLAREVQKLLGPLGMPGGQILVDVSPTAPSGAGGDLVAFLAQLNVGIEARPLAQVASGGELSRLMLALKVVLARHDAVPTLVFDEVDQGIGGEVGVQVAQALDAVARQRQVLVITHLAPIAARAARHLKIGKRPVGGISTAEVVLLDEPQREVEVARMLGDPDDTSLRAHAAELLKRRVSATGATKEPEASEPAPARERAARPRPPRAGRKASG